MVRTPCHNIPPQLPQRPPPQRPLGTPCHNVGATNYPIVNGGDGINHFPGGGANYDNAPAPPAGPYAFAGAQTTDTTSPLAILFGTVVGTFTNTPTRADWFRIGTGGTFTVPA